MPDPLRGTTSRSTRGRARRRRPSTFARGSFPRSISISGRVLLFEAGSETSVLFDAYDGDDDIREYEALRRVDRDPQPAPPPGDPDRHSRPRAPVRGNGPDRASRPRTGSTGSPRGWGGTNGVNGLASPPVESTSSGSTPIPIRRTRPPCRCASSSAAAGLRTPARGATGRHPPSRHGLLRQRGRPAHHLLLLHHARRQHRQRVRKPDGERRGRGPRGDARPGGAGGTFTSPFGAEIASLLDVQAERTARRASTRSAGPLGDSSASRRGAQRRAGSPAGSLDTPRWSPPGVSPARALAALRLRRHASEDDRGDRGGVQRRRSGRH